MLKNIPPETIWLAMGVILVLLELVIPGLIIIFFGAGALITAATTWIGLTETLTSQVLTFTGSSIALLLLVRFLLKKLKQNKSEDTTNLNIELGKMVDVIEMIEPNKTGGKVRYQGADWNARCNGTAVPGDSVRITGCDNLTLIVEKNVEKGVGKEIEKNLETENLETEKLEIKGEKK